MEAKANPMVTERSRRQHSTQPKAQIPIFISMKCHTYILECADGSYYTGSTKFLSKRFRQHQQGQGANHTSKRLPVKIVYLEEFTRIDHAFYREKQIQGWSRAKKEALIFNQPEKLHELAKCLNETSHENYKKD